MKKQGLFFLSLALSISAFAQDLESGKVYQFLNVGQPGYAMAISKSMTGAVTETADAKILRQQWYLEANEDNTGFYMRNVANGSYLTSSTVTSGQWDLTITDKPVDNTMLMTISDFQEYKVIRALVNKNNSYGFAHSDAAHNVVNWNTNAVATSWTVEEIPYTEEEIAAMFQRFEDDAKEIAKAEKNAAVRHIVTSVCRTFTYIFFLSTKSSNSVLCNKKKKQKHKRGSRLQTFDVPLQR